MTTNHTPGPWRYVEHTANAGGTIAARFGLADLIIADIPTTVNERGFGHLEADANARLIASAPDLLAALEKHVEWVERDKDGAIDPEWDYDTMVGQYIRAAIARAKGE
jgi:hypothetical protein